MRTVDLYEVTLTVCDALEAVLAKRPLLLLVSLANVRDPDQIPVHWGKQSTSMIPLSRFAPVSRVLSIIQLSISPPPPEYRTSPTWPPLLARGKLSTTGSSGNAKPTRTSFTAQHSRGRSCARRVSRMGPAARYGTH
ncbi:hypothetical protein BC827DRAFT_1233687 [Russula dissimulans]|nr:hypothetical protein BC827DRAFT_1233687 [Russula dissimulans]